MNTNKKGLGRGLKALLRSKGRTEQESKNKDKRNKANKDSAVISTSRGYILMRKNSMN